MVSESEWLDHSRVLEGSSVQSLRVETADRRSLSIRVLRNTGRSRRIPRCVMFAWCDYNHRFHSVGGKQ